MAKSSTNVSDPKTTSIENLARTKDQILSTYPLDAQSILLDNLYAPEGKLISLAAEKGFNIKKFLDDRDALVNLVKKQTESGQLLPEEKQEEKKIYEQEKDAQHQHFPEDETKNNRPEEVAKTPKPIDQANELGNQPMVQKISQRPPMHRPVSRSNFFQRLRPSGIQNRIYKGLNRGSRIGRGAARTGTRIGGRLAATGGKLATRLLATPWGWAIIGVVILIAIVLSFLMFFTSNDAPPPTSSVACETVPGAQCVTTGSTCPVVNGEQTTADLSGSYVCAPGSTGGTQTCCLPPSRPGYYIPPFGCGLKYYGSTYTNHTSYAVDFNRHDKSNETGDPVKASANGTVSKIRYYNGEVQIKHDPTHLTLYAHMQNITVTENQPVTVGQKIGEVDNTADCHICTDPPNPACRTCTTGTHLHVGQYENGSPTQISFYGVPYPVSVSPSRYIPDSYPITGACP